MGCINDSDKWKHWFANVHLSGPCNRRCYFCIGQHMMALDSFNSLDTKPADMKGMGEFLEECTLHEVKEVFLTGTNTDPSLYRHHEMFVEFLRRNLQIPIGIRTNGTAHVSELEHYDNGSITICSLNPSVNLKMMGGPPCDLGEIALHVRDISKWKINCVLGPENANSQAITEIVEACSKFGIPRVNLREPYGQPHVGIERLGLGPVKKRILQDTVDVYDFGDVEVSYWDVHFVGVRSVNLYANGRVSKDYPITKGHVEGGVVIPQDQFDHGRHQKQWLT
jgi:hypothetical protein